MRMFQGLFVFLQTISWMATPDLAPEIQGEDMCYRTRTPQRYAAVGWHLQRCYRESLRKGIQLLGADPSRQYLYPEHCWAASRFCFLPARHIEGRGESSGCERSQRHRVVDKLQACACALGSCSSSADVHKVDGHGPGGERLVPAAVRVTAVVVLLCG